MATQSESTRTSSGRIVPILGTSAGAFVPAPLPPTLRWTTAMVSLHEKAARSLGHLAGVGRILPDARLLMRPFMRREAVLSSRIEGTQASVSQLVIFEADRDAKVAEVSARSEDLKEVRNYFSALMYGLQRKESLPIGVRLMRELHARLMKGVRGQEQTPGEFRSRQNWIGKTGSSIESARFVPPPVPQMLDALSDLEKFIHAQDDFPVLARIALAHYQFEAIHPFLDGNGRVGRLLITLLLCAFNVIEDPLLYLSDYFERHRKEYYDHLLAVSAESAWSEWLEFFLTGVSEQSEEAALRAKTLLDLREEYHRLLQKAKASALPIKLVDHLFQSPAVTISDAAEALNVTTPGATKIVQKLEKAGILREATGRRYDRIYVADGIVKATEV